MLTLSVRSRQGLAANFRAYDAAFQVGSRRAIRENGEFCRELAQLLCPRRTNFMANHIRTEYSADGLSYRTGWREKDFAEAGFAPYFIFVVKGTRYMAAQDPLTPAFREAEAQLREDLRELRRESVRRANGGRRRR